MVAISAFLIAFTFLAVRINIVIPGLALEELEGLENAYSDFRLHFQYFPNFWEWGITFFSYTITLLLLYVGAKNLSLTGQSITKGE
jgi:molybdopterin-containing oxidoreductase family membrane subunit